MRNLLIIIIALLCCAGCGRKETLRPFGWRALGGEADSLICKLEWQYSNYSSPDSMAKNVARLKDVARFTGNPRQCMARHHFWKAKLMQRLQYEDSARKEALIAARFCDSTEFHYDYLKIKSILYLLTDTIQGAEKYSHYETCINTARKSGDFYFEALSCINMGNLLSHINEFDKSLYYMHRADSIFHTHGVEGSRYKNMINIARIHWDMGNRRKADSIYRSLLRNRHIVNDEYARNLVRRNLFISTHDIEDIRPAYADVANDSNQRALRGIYRALLAEYFRIDGNNQDSFIYYATAAVNDLPYISDPAHKGVVYINRSLAFLLTNQLDSAYIYRCRYEEENDNARRIRDASEVMNLSTLNALNERKALYEAHLYKRTIIIVVIIAVALIGAVAAFFFMKRRRMQYRLKSMSDELKLQNARSRIAMATLTIEDKDNLLGVIKDELTKMTKHRDGIDYMNLKRVESSIKAHLSTKESEESFMESFEVVNPHFSDKLRAISPDIAESYIKLACYILMELDNKKTARLMMIKPESVHQARWRLRQKLGLKAGESLEDFLRSLNASNP